MEMTRDDNEMKTTNLSSLTTLTSREGRTFTVPLNVLEMFKKYEKSTFLPPPPSWFISEDTCSEEETIVHTNSSQRQNSDGMELAFGGRGNLIRDRLDISSDILEKVVEYCTYYTNVEPMNEIQRPLQSNQLKVIVTQEWYYNFISRIENDAILLFRLVNAANYLKIQPLLSLVVSATALCIREDDEEEIKSVFKVPSSSSLSSSSSSMTLSSPPRSRRKEETSP